MRSIGENIRKYRLMRNMRQEDLAEKTDLSSNYIGMIERGEKIPSLETFIAIINALDASADIILSNLTNSGYEVKESLLNEKLDNIPEHDREMVFDVIDTMLKHIN